MGGLLDDSILYMDGGNPGPTGPWGPGGHNPNGGGPNPNWGGPGWGGLGGGYFNQYGEEGHNKDTPPEHYKNLHRKWKAEWWSGYTDHNFITNNEMAEFRRVRGKFDFSTIWTEKEFNKIRLDARNTRKSQHSESEATEYLRSLIEQSDIAKANLIRCLNDSRVSDKTFWNLFRVYKKSFKHLNEAIYADAEHGKY